MNAIFARHDLPLCAGGHGAVLSIYAARTVPVTYRETLGHDAALLSRLHRELMAVGIWIFARGNLMISAAHGSDEMAETLEKLETVSARLAKDGK